MKRNKKVIGLTGNIAAGKSAVTKILREKGYDVIDADLVAREVVAKGTSGLAGLIERFGQEYLKEDGHLDRKKLGSKVFSDEKALQELNEYMQPLIRKDILDKINQSANEVIFVDGALLFETGFDEEADLMWLVTAPHDIRVKRIIKRDGLMKKEAEKRINSQWPQEEKEKLADVIIENTGSLQELHDKVVRYLP